MTDSTKEIVRRAIYDHFALRGNVPQRGEMALELGLSDHEIDDTVSALVRSRDIVVDEQGEVVMAHPFAAINLGFSVMGEATLWWGGCAWDSFAIPHLVDAEPSVLVATTCPACGTAHSWTVNRDVPPEGDQVAHFLTPATHIWDDVVHACANQRIFCSEDCVSDWLANTGNQRGSVFDLSTLWRLASHWYDGRLDSPYIRREPSGAAAYFASVGLQGEFWGLPDSP